MDENQLAVPNGWVAIENLRSYGKVYNGLSGKTKDDFGEGEPYIPYVNVFKNSKIDSNELSYVKIKGGEIQNKVIYGDIIFTTSSETIEEVGMTSVSLEKDKSFYLNSFCFIYRLNNFNELLPEFAQFLFRSDRVRYQISLLGQGSTRYNLSKTRLLKELKLTVPKSKKEQQKISQILFKIDQAISQTEALISKYNRIKNGVMQDLLSKGIDQDGNIRNEAMHEFQDSPLGLIPKEWKYCSLGDQVTLQRGFDITSKQAVSGEIPIISSSGLTGYHNQAMVKGPGVVTGRKGTLGKVFFVEGDYWPHDTTLWVKDFKGNDPYFISIILEGLKLEKFDASTANPTLNRNFIYPLPVIVPADRCEQEQIASIKQSLDKPIIQFQIELEKLQVIKSGLMHDLLTGKVRVNHLIKEKQPA